MATTSTPTSQPNNTATTPTNQQRSNTAIPTSQPNNTATTPASHPNNTATTPASQQNNPATTPTGSRTIGGGTTLPLDGVNAPGAYVCAWSGHLLRVPEDGDGVGRSPTLDMVGNKPLLVTKISDNPFVTLTKARLLASDYDIHVNF